ncbi:MAG TPA: hypothetical protein VI485_26525 [Vicinamibacterales bacterium]|nr:hypothetical protein [Vicinamibacterales bacterium]
MGHQRVLSILIAVVASLIITAKASSAQTSDDGPAALPAAPIPLAGQLVVPPALPVALDSAELARRIAALRQWTREYSDWIEWNERWQGRMEPGLFGVRERRKKPAPPAWLLDECRNVTEADDTLANGCQLLAAWREDYGAKQVRERILAQRTQHEAPTKTTWWNYLHVDALWSTPAVSATYGVVGIHATLKVVGRWQIFVAPGAILLNVPTSGRTREWRPATDLGVSYRLIDMNLPGSHRQGTLHVNFARAWIMGGAESLVNSSVDLVGLSVTFK